jgi:hypothetical protein
MADNTNSVSILENDLFIGSKLEPSSSSRQKIVPLPFYFGKLIASSDLPTK